MKAREGELNRQLKYIKHNLKATRSCPINRNFAFVTRADLMRVFGDTTIVTIRHHDSVYKPGLLEDDRVILDRALIVTSESALDCRLVSQEAEDEAAAAATDNSQMSTDSGIAGGTQEAPAPAEESKKVQPTKTKKKPPKVVFKSWEEELEASADIVLGKPEVHQRLFKSKSSI